MMKTVLILFEKNGGNSPPPPGSAGEIEMASIRRRTLALSLAGEVRCLKYHLFYENILKSYSPRGSNLQGGWNVKRPNAHVAHGLSLGGLYIRKERAGELKSKRSSFT